MVRVDISGSAGLGTINQPADRKEMTPWRSHMMLGWRIIYQSCTVAYSTDYSREEGNPRRSLKI